MYPDKIDLSERDEMDVVYPDKIEFIYEKMKLDVVYPDEKNR